MLGMGKASTARAHLWTGGEQCWKPERWQASPIQSSSEAWFICWDQQTCWANRSTPRPLAWLQQHLVSEHLFLKGNVFQLSWDLARSEEILLLFSGCQTCHFSHLYLDGKHCSPLLCMLEQACLDRWQCRNSWLLQVLICTARMLLKPSLLTSLLSPMLKQVPAC